MKVKSKRGVVSIILMLMLAMQLCIFSTGCAEVDSDTLEALSGYLGEETGVEEIDPFELIAQRTIHFVDNYDIAVVFDNSGSMYTNSDNTNSSWCRAKYAMEIFASMLDYDDIMTQDGGTAIGDRLEIFPMWPVMTDGSTPGQDSGEGSIEPICITCKDDVEKIHDMYTVRARGTPFSTVEQAYSYLQTSKANKRWLLVLTDGEFDQMNVADFATKLRDMASEDIQVQYLGIGEAANLDEYATDVFHTKKSQSSESLRGDIVEICNYMFQRDTLPASALSGTNLNLDLSMRTLIVFAQGTDAEIKGLTSVDGKEVSVKSDSGKLTYSPLGAANYPNAPVDDQLAGQIVTFENCPVGSYTLDCTGADNIQLFYSPFVDIMLTFSGENGKVIDMKGNGEALYPGEYTLNYYLVDGCSGENVTNSPLLGNVSFEGGVRDSSGSFTPVENGGKITLQPDAATFLSAQATYLDDYTINTSDRESDYTVAIDFPAIDSEIEITQKDAKFYLGEINNWEPILVHLSLNGDPLNATQMENTELVIGFDDEKNIEYSYEKVPAESLVKVYLGKDASGNIVKPDSGPYELSASAKYVSSATGNELTGKTDTDDLKVERLPKWLKLAIIAAAILLLIAFILWWMLHKSMPKNMYFNSTTTGPKKYTKVRKGSMPLIAGEGGKYVSCTALPDCKHKDRGGNGASVKFTKVTPTPQVKQVAIKNKVYTKSSGGEFLCDGKPLSKEEFVIRNNTPIDVMLENRSFSGTVSFVRKQTKKSKGKKGKR